MKSKGRKTALGQKLIGALEEAIAVEKGALKAGLVRQKILIKDPPEWSPKEIKALRSTLALSQAGLANLLAVAKETVCAWEQGVNEPSGIARRTLQILSMNPQLVNRLPKAS